MIFHRPGPALVCTVSFGAAIVAGLFKLYFWHYPVFFFTSRFFKRYFTRQRRKSFVFIREVGKAGDQLACACLFGGRHDETISNRAGRIFKEKSWHSPWWVIVTKKITEKWEENHIENSIEPLRPDIDHEQI